MTKSDLKPGDKVIGRFQNLNINLIVTTIETSGPRVWLKHDTGEVYVRKQDINLTDKTFDLVVTPRS